jgi:arabinofuranosyltransferase
VSRRPDSRRAARLVRRGQWTLPWFAILTGAAVIWGVAAAWRRAWLSDDAYISFRYAENLVNGLGLVFNRGERVEGYSNFLWTIWVAFGMELGAGPEGWSIFWGLACYAASIVLLALIARRLSGGPAAAAFVPAGALLAALHPAWSRFATSGLETSLFTFLALLGFFVVTSKGPRSVATGGAVFALLAMTRPDGPILALPAGLYVLFAQRDIHRRWAWIRAAVLFAAAFAALWIPYTLWRVSYYGSFFPNTYYAKSADLAWWSQGFKYLELYALKYWPLLPGVALGVAALLGRSRFTAPQQEAGRARMDTGPGLLALAMLATYTLYVARVGGDFMFARFLIPVTPFLLVLTDLGCQRLLGRRPLAVAGATAALVLAMLAMPDPIRGTAIRDGIVNEWALYTPEFSGRIRATGETMRPYLEGLPVRMAFLGAEARAIYYSKVGAAIECVTGLTDSAIARQPLPHRERVGHEKRASADYLLGRGGANLVMSPTEFKTLGLQSRIPAVSVQMGDHVAMLLRWEPELVAGLLDRGARLYDLPAALDQYLASIDSQPDSAVAQTYRQVKLLYLDPAGDREREAVFLRRLERGGASRGVVLR